MTPLKIHPLMLAAAIAFWGWQTGLWLAAAPIAIALCTSFYVLLRWPLTLAHYTRVADFCSVFALLLGGYFYLTYGNPRAIILFFLWLPVIALPLALAHAYGSSERMDLRVLFWSLRRRPRTRYEQGYEQRPVTFDPWFAYYTLWIVAAAAANTRSEWFYIGLVALVSWPLVRLRPWSYPVGAWGIAFSAAIMIGYGVQYGLHQTQQWLEEMVPEWISASGSRTDPYRSSTDIGHIGKLKDSGVIVLRVTTTDGAQPPRLLHRASYNAYFDAAWAARGVGFTRVEPTAENRWHLVSNHNADQSPAARVTIHDYSAPPNPVLSLPAGTTAIERLSAINVQRNPLGAVQIVREPGFFSYTASYAGTQAFDAPPAPEDLRLPPNERNAFTVLAEKLSLKALTPSEAARSVQAHFADGYRYSTFRKDTSAGGSPLVDFLQRSKSGHCEYFATATVLLLRAGGVPARYATGFVVAEYSELEKAWIVRTRHAHAWVRAYLNGAWVDIDTTPPSWFEIEAEDAGAWSNAWTKAGDLWSWLRFRGTQAWDSSDERQLLNVGLIIVLPFALWLAWRLFRSRNTTENNQLKQMLISPSRMGADSEFYRVEQRLAEQGWGRRTDETANDWLVRLKVDAKMDTESLTEIVELHNRYRFDPVGLNNVERLRLTSLVNGYLEGKLPRFNFSFG